jgi:DNA-binding GntR family transcriptional regulator
MASISKLRQRPTLMQQALESIRQAIESGDLKPGERLVETQLAEQMQISRFPIREALRFLEKEGLVETRPFKGTRVARFTPEDIEEIYSLRSALEELAVRIWVPQGAQKIVARLQSTVRAMEQAAEQDDPDGMVAQDARFHRIVCEAANHQRLLAVWRDLEKQQHMLMRMEKFYYEDLRAYVATHYLVLEALASGDGEQAARAVREHIATALEHFKACRDANPDTLTRQE